METAEQVFINPLVSPALGGILKLGGTPRPPAGSFLHLFFGGLRRNCMDALAGVRVIDFSMGAAGPWSADLLAWMGAEVIKVESSRHPEIMRIILDPVTRQPQSPNRSLLFETVNSNKLGVTLDLMHSEAIELAQRL